LAAPFGTNRTPGFTTGILEGKRCETISQMAGWCQLPRRQKQLCNF